jgi:hypothetical protein
MFISIGENMSKINKYRLLTGNKYIIPRFGGTLGTFENWIYGKYKTIAFNIELCKTRVPTDTATIFDTCLKNTGVDLYICERALNLK